MSGSLFAPQPVFWGWLIALAISGGLCLTFVVYRGLRFVRQRPGRHVRVEGEVIARAPVGESTQGRLLEGVVVETSGGQRYRVRGAERAVIGERVIIIGCLQRDGLPGGYRETGRLEVMEARRLLRPWPALTRLTLPFVFCCGVWLTCLARLLW